MEALVAFGLAANIAQFIAIAGKTVEKTVELSTSRKTLLDENADLEKIVTDFLNVVPSIKSVKSESLEKDEKLQALAEEAKRIADNIQAKFDAIKARRAKRRRSEKLFATLKELRMKDDLNSLKHRLSDFRSEIVLHINLRLMQHQTQIQENLKGSTENNRAYKERIESKLNDLIAEVNARAFPIISDEGQSGKAWRGSSQQLEDLVTGVRSWKPQIEEFQKAMTIVGGLQFSQFEERRNAIIDAHRNTYQWVFDSEVANFKGWLGDKNAPIYWITGNAGSGKSTLMKYIHGHRQLQSRLRAWARGRRIYFANHFFWSAGTPMQQSQEGLLRTLLFQVLLERPELTPRVFPEKWNRPVETSNTLCWSVKELFDGLLLLCSAIGPDYLFIFIDGLDEYGGEHDALLGLIKSLGEISGIKLCVSSRPWLEFRDAFEDKPWKLSLQDLTRSDIQTYIRDHLEDHYRFKRLSLRNESAARDLVNKITTRAQGVFLWVYLVVKSMIRGLINADDMKHLHRRLDDLPQELEQFFHRILDSIDDFYKNHTARLLLVLAHSRTPMTLISFYFLDQEEGLPFDPESFLRDWPNINAEELDAVDTKKRQLIAQCKDLVQIIEYPNAPVLFNFKASFLHRTVIDFVKSPQIHEKLFEDAGLNFNPVVTLFELNTRQFQSLIHLISRVYLKPYLRNWYLASIYYARETEASLNISVAQQLNHTTNRLLDYLEDRAGIRYSFGEAFHQLLDDQDSLEEDHPDSLLELCIFCGLRLYVSSVADVESDKYNPTILDALNPILQIEQASDFLINFTPVNAQRNPIPASAETSYNSTFHMFTPADAELLQELEAETSQQIQGPRSRRGTFGTASPTPRPRKKLGYWARLRRTLLR
ncbi:hypothetical protein F5Y04DRAFT_77451 [Hypomontagnella monticulosa]|nr:hypothetical protein F5Y04DRAFT_77451 [Hypomontagnella monticulosa]